MDQLQGQPTEPLATGSPGETDVASGEARTASAGAPGSAEPIPPVFEPADSASVRPATEPVRVPAAARRFRLWTAIVATIAVVATAVGVLAFTASATVASPTLAYAPATSVIYADTRLDLPGDQHDQLARFLAHFPGFADTSALDRKLSDTFDRLANDATGGRYSYSGDLAPWAAGPVAVVAMSLPVTAQPANPSDAVAATHVAILVAVKDATKAQAELDKLKADAVAGGASPTSSDVQGTTVWTLTGGDQAGAGISYALAPDMLMATLRPADVGTLLDVKAGRASSLATSDAYRTASAGAPADRLGSFYVNAKALVDAGLAAGPVASLLPSGALQKVPDTVFASVRAESDRVVFDLATSGGAAGSATTARASALVDHVPGTAIAYVEVHDVGTGLAAAIGQLKAMPELQQYVSSLGQFEAMLGGDLGSFVSWIGDVGIVVEKPTAGGSIPAIGLVATVTDESAATAKLATLRNLIALGGASSGVTVTDADHAGTTITTITASGASGAGPGVPTSVSYALAGGRLVLGLGSDFVPGVLDLQPSGSLAGVSGFSDAMKAAGGPAATRFFYVDLRAVRQAVEASMPAGDRPAYETNTQPYLAPLDRIVGLSADRTSRVIVTVSTP